MGEPTPPPVQLAPGQQPTPEQIQQIQNHMRAEAQKLGLTMEQYVQRLREKAQQEMQAQAQTQAQQQAQQGQVQQQQGQQQAGSRQVTPGPPKPEAIAVADFLRSQDLKPRTCIFQGNRRDMFRVKRAIRALQSPAYEKARSKNPKLPEVKNRTGAENVFKLLPMSLLALRVVKVEEDDHEGHSHGKKKRVKGLWNVRIEQQQETQDDMHYMWLYQGSQWKQRAYALVALALVMTGVMFPLWPLVLRQAVWYLSMGFFVLMALFLVMSIFRLILFCVTMFTHPPGLWLYPNLFADVGFFDSFRPVWAWHQDKKAERKAKKAAREAKAAARAAKANGNQHVTPSTAATETKTTGSDAQPSKDSLAARQRNLQASVEEAEDD